MSDNGTPEWCTDELFRKAIESDVRAFTLSDAIDAVCPYCRGKNKAVRMGRAMVHKIETAETGAVIAAVCAAKPLWDMFENKDSTLSHT